MKNIISTVAALALLSVSAHAANMKYNEDEVTEPEYVESAPATASKKYYVGAGLAFETWPDYGADMGNGIALLINGGMPLPQVLPNFGVEVEMSFDLSGPSYSATYPSFNGTTIVNKTYTVDYGLFTLAGYGTYSYTINPKISVRGRAGLIYKSISVDTNYAYGASSSSEIGIALGGGGYYSVTPDIDAYVDMTLVDYADIMHFTVGAQYKF